MPHSEEWGAKLQKDSPDLVLRLERSPPTPGSGDTLRGSCGQRARARAGSGLRLARDHSGPGDGPRARPGCRSQAPPSAGRLRGSPPAAWRAITGRGSAPPGPGGRWRGPSPWGAPRLARSHGEAQGPARASPDTPDKCLPPVAGWHQPGGGGGVLGGGGVFCP